MTSFQSLTRGAVAACAIGLFSAFAGGPQPALALSNTTLSEAVATATGLSPDVRAFYSERNFKPIWMGAGNKARVSALLDAVSHAADHGLPAPRYQEEALRAAVSTGDPAAAELLATSVFLAYAQDLTAGALEPSSIDREIAVKRPMRSGLGLLNAVSKSSPKAFFRALAPRNPAYRALLREKKILEAELAKGNTRPLPTRLTKRGSKGEDIVALKARLVELGYGPLNAEPVFDEELRQAVKKFQKANGLGADGVVGRGTLSKLGGTAADKLKKVVINLERERWMNRDRGQRYIVVNIPDFSFNMYENGKVAFHSIVVVGRGTSDRRTPEFHDEMTHMVVNPTWHVPPSIAGKEYLPTLKRKGGLRGMRVISRSGRVVDTSTVDFSQYSAKNFPFSIKQPPGPRNALGRVKFLFPNRFNIYLHDTPSKSLFKREVRAFSHGCIRVQRPFEFAEALLSKQTANPEGAFQTWLKSGREQYVNLQTPVPVFLTYKTAFVDDDGKVHYRGDIYGRDKKMWKALISAGVSSAALDS